MTSSVQGELTDHMKAVILAGGLGTRLAKEISDITFGRHTSYSISKVLGG
jgi:hypothetical protein